MQQPVGQTWNGGHRIQMGGPSTTAPPLATTVVDGTSTITLALSLTECCCNVADTLQWSVHIKCCANKKKTKLKRQATKMKNADT